MYYGWEQMHIKTHRGLILAYKKNWLICILKSIKLELSKREITGIETHLFLSLFNVAFLSLKLYEAQFGWNDVKCWDIHANTL